MMLKRILLSGKPEYLASKLVTHNSQDTRSGSTLLPARASLNLSKSSFIYRAIKLYNQLPEHIRKVDKITSFKEETKEWIKSKSSHENEQIERDLPRGSCHSKF
jgi:hypothetical protein